MPPIDTDLLCVQCGYNLRTQSANGTCPECGKRVVDTLANPLRSTDPQRIEWIRFGLWWLFIGIGARTWGEGHLAIGAVINYSIGMRITDESNIAHVTAALVFVGVTLFITRVNGKPLRYALMALWVLAGLLATDISLYLPAYFVRGYLQIELAGVYRLAGVLFVVLPLTHARARWAHWLLIAAVSEFVAIITLSYALRLEYPNGLIPDYLLWLWHGVYVAQAVVPLLIALHVTTLARQCAMEALAYRGRWLIRIMVASVLLYAARHVAQPIISLFTAQRQPTVPLRILFHMITLQTIVMQMVLAVYLVAFARKFRPIPDQVQVAA